MSISFPHLPHISNMVDAFYPPSTLQVLPVAKTSPQKLIFVCSSQRVLPIEELLLLSASADVDPLNGSGDSFHCLNNGNGVVGIGDNLSEDVLKERIRRMRIGMANKGKVPWNKGRKHSAGSLFTFQWRFMCVAKVLNLQFLMLLEIAKNVATIVIVDSKNLDVAVEIVVADRF